MSGDRVLAESDCEACRHGVITQPVNTVSSFAYVVAGADMLRGADRTRTEKALAWATVAAGLGSVAYHGPGGVLSRYAHDASLIAMLGLLAVTGVEELAGEGPAPTAALVAVPALAALGARPRTSAGAQVVAGAVATGVEVARAVRGTDGRGRSLRRRPEGPVFVVGALAHVLGRTGGPLCHPDSRLQPHALWHALTAATMWLRVGPPRTEPARA